MPRPDPIPLVRERLARFRASDAFLPAVLTVLFLLFGGVGLAWGSWRNLCATCPSVAQIKTWEPEQTSKLLSHDGRLIAELGFERRTPVSIQALPPYVPQAVIAIEDRRFYSHSGFDVRGITRAVFGRLTGRRSLGGGSTITQQLARNMFDERIGFVQEGLAGYTRKLKELQVALELERSYTKDQILEAYLNEIYMGRGWGFQSASRAYFGKDVREVNPAEAALLAAILNLPGAFDPFRRPEAALRRRNLVLDRMAAHGFMAPAEAAEWQAHPLPDRDHSGSSIHGIAPYFEEWVRQILDSRFGEAVYRGGLQVYTTLDHDMQRSAVEAMEWGWARIEDLPNFRHTPRAEIDSTQSFPENETPYLQGMIVALDPQTGAVRALVGGRDFEESKFDRARLARRQAGSSFKPFVYAAALASGIPASHIVVDQPVVYPQVSGEDWRPRNFEEEFLGPMTIRDGLRRSVNMVAIKLGWEEVGIETVRRTAERMGIRTEIEPFPSTTIGAAEVIPLQLAEAYSAFPTLGTKVRPFPIVRVENAAGEVLWEPQPERTQVLDSLVARIMVDMLEDAANNGTGGNHRSIGELPYEVSTAGKTGTTNDGTNAWFMGFTPNLIAGVWFGMDRPVPMARGAPQATGGYYAAPVWGRFMKHVYYGREATEDGDEAFEPALAVPEPWPMLPGLTTREVDRVTGRLWSRWCDAENAYTEYYVPGTEPTEVCDATMNRFRIPRVGGVRPSAPGGG
jgi:penicillin-binding protein 1A